MKVRLVMIVIVFFKLKILLCLADPALCDVCHNANAGLVFLLCLSTLLLVMGCIYCIVKCYVNEGKI